MFSLDREAYRSPSVSKRRYRGYVSLKLADQLLQDFGIQFFAKPLFFLHFFKGYVPSNLYITWFSDDCHPLKSTDMCSRFGNLLPMSAGRPIVLQGHCPH
ncbi:hypothetical protein [Nostoc sp. C117]|uniref:hypothetical protein n=1 Tax=Nostoc sp. C117 TaxID=3349875 RepID=UPI00370D4ADD